MTRTVGIDYGHKRVGLALSDSLGITAQPFESVPRGEAVARIIEVCKEYQVANLVVGMPSPLGGGESESSRLARAFGEEVAGATGLEVIFVDERFTSRMAEEALLSSGMKRRERRSKVDKVAAAIILQTYLDGNFRIVPDVGETGAQ